MMDSLAHSDPQARQEIASQRAPQRAPAEGFRLPGPRDRIAVLGRTGSGKTHFGVWLLSQANWPQRPWLIIDFKHDDFLRQLTTTELGLTERLPRQPGLYIVHPRPDQLEDVEGMLWRVWRRERTGLYADEGYLLPERGALQALLTQGRSKQIPVIMLSQRPVKVSRFVFSEADFFSVFHLNDKRDKDTVRSFAPVDLQRPLPRHHSHYYDVAEDRLYRMQPAPPRGAILDIFDRRSNRTRWRKI
jgi:hypothetical protein